MKVTPTNHLDVLLVDPGVFPDALGCANSDSSLSRAGNTAGVFRAGYPQDPSLSTGACPGVPRQPEEHD